MRTRIVGIKTGNRLRLNGRFYPAKKSSDFISEQLRTEKIFGFLGLERI